MTSAIIIDDIQRHREDLVRLLKSYPDINVVAECKSGLEGLEAIAFKKPHLVFLDIEMPGMSGFEMLSKISERNFFIIFTTAHDKYAINAINMVSMCYLTKSINESDLQVAISRFYNEQDSHMHQKQFEVLIENEINQKKKKIVITSNSNKRFLSPDEIVYCSGSGSGSPYTDFHLNDGKSETAVGVLKFFEELLLDCGFERTHKSYLVNMKYVKSIKNNELIIQHYTSVRIPIARDRQAVFKTKYLK